MMAVTVSLITGLLIAVIYRLLRHRAIFPGAREGHKAIAWLRIIGITLFVAVFLWVPLTVLENFPD
jgi:xanthosine utilization system XapX-like protein